MFPRLGGAETPFRQKSEAKRLGFIMSVISKEDCPPKGNTIFLMALLGAVLLFGKNEQPQPREQWYDKGSKAEAVVVRALLSALIILFLTDALLYLFLL